MESRKDLILVSERSRYLKCISLPNEAVNSHIPDLDKLKILTNSKLNNISSDREFHLQNNVYKCPNSFILSIWSLGEFHQSYRTWDKFSPLMLFWSNNLDLKISQAKSCTRSYILQCVILLCSSSFTSCSKENCNKSWKNIFPTSNIRTTSWNGQRYPSAIKS